MKPQKLFSSIGCIVLIFLTATAQQKPVLASVDIVHNSFFSKRDILEHLPSVVNQPSSDENLKKIIESVQSLYRDNGFYFFSIDSVGREYSDDSSSLSIRLYITEGKRIVISRIVIEGNAAVPAAELRSLLNISTGEPLNSALLESDIHAMLELYSNRGFPFTKIGSQKISIDPEDSSALNVVLQIDEGPKVFLDEIQVQGNTSTNTEVVAREARLQRGELFNQEKLVRIQKRLERSQLFSSVSEPQLYVLSGNLPDSMRGGVLITVKEGGTNTFDGVVGYVPETVPGTKGYFTGNIFISMRNLFGTGRKATIKWQRENEQTQELYLQYLEPWLFGIPLNAGGSFLQRKQDSSYVKTKLDFRVEYGISEELLIAMNLSTEDVFPASGLQHFSVFQSHTMLFGGELQYDTRDNVLSPRSGVRYSTTFEGGSKKITGPENYLYLTNNRTFSIRKYSVDAELYLSVIARQVLMAGIHGRQTTSSQLELSDLYPFGGTNSVRGYRENQFFASRLAWVNLEYRFLTGRSSSLFAFADAGYYSRPDDALRGITFQENNIYGYGAGTRVETGLGILSVSYALGRGDSFSNGKIHIGIINEF
ncbi:MAG: POTRA domain-containing protein [Bacteroidota bacterium]